MLLPSSLPHFEGLYPQAVNPNTPLLPCFGQTFSYGNENSSKYTLGSCALYDTELILKMIYDNHITGSSYNFANEKLHPQLTLPLPNGAKFYLLLSAFTGT